MSCSVVGLLKLEQFWTDGNMLSTNQASSLMIMLGLTCAHGGSCVLLNAVPDLFVSAAYLKYAHK